MSTLLVARPIETRPSSRTWEPPEVDCTPAVRMREELARERAAGKAFDEVWQRCILRATHSLSGEPSSGSMARSERAEWRELFAQQRHYWRAAYNREPVPDVLRMADSE